MVLAVTFAPSFIRSVCALGISSMVRFLPPWYSPPRRIRPPPIVPEASIVLDRNLSLFAVTSMFPPLPSVPRARYSPEVKICCSAKCLIVPPLAPETSSSASTFSQDLNRVLIWILPP